VIKVKEVKVRPQIGNHDLKWRADQAIGWLNDNAQIKFKIQAYGRIGYKPELIQETYDRFLELLGENAKVLTPLKRLTPVLYEATIIKNK
jgi:translation initiation factor IF-3